jgi:hypothetical protein
MNLFLPRWAADVDYEISHDIIVKSGSNATIAGRKKAPFFRSNLAGSCGDLRQGKTKIFSQKIMKIYSILFSSSDE